MSQYGTSFFTPDVPIPDPPGANFFVKLPIYLVGVFFVFYLVYNIYLELVDWERMKNPSAFSSEEGGIPEGAPIPHPHVDTDKADKCLNCHFPPLSKAAKDFLKQKSDIDLEDLPSGIDPAIFDDELFEQMLRGEYQESSSYAVEVGEFRGGRVCLDCHTPEKFDIAHLGHRLQPLESCSTCHRLHSPFVRPMLSNTPAELCKQCHEYP